MDFFVLVEARRSIRSFTSELIAEDDLDRILEAVRLAPTAGNLQAFQMVVTRDRGVKKMLAQAAWGQEFLAQAPLVIGFVCDGKRCGARYGNRGRDLYALQDATIAATYAMLAAADLGLGCVWVGAFDPRKVYQILDCREGELPVALLAIGHPAENPAARPRRDITELVRRL